MILIGEGDNLNLDDVHFDEELHFFGGGLENQVACREIIMLPTVASAAAPPACRTQTPSLLYLVCSRFHPEDSTHLSKNFSVCVCYVDEQEMSFRNQYFKLHVFLSSLCFQYHFMSQILSSQMMLI